jgi:branched-chain amino acid transport system ATP-binding protein
VSPRLECTGLSGGRGPTTVFRHVDLAVDGGEILALLGPNGAGKTTLLLTIGGLLPAKAGRVCVDGTVLGNGRPTRANRAGIVLVPDNRCLFTTMSVEENLRVGTRKGGPVPRDMLDVFPVLERRWHVRAGALSGGEQQMLAMARGLIQQPRVLLVDELSMGLAPLIVESLFEAVRRIAREHGCAVVVVEQHVDIALDVADTAAVLHRGEIVVHDRATALRAEPERLEQAYFGVMDGVARGTAPSS